MKITREQVVEYADNAFSAGFKAFPVPEKPRLVAKKCKRKNTGDCAALCICPDRRMRNCLGHGCDTEFMSNDKSHRLCARCYDPYRGIGFEPYEIPLRSGRGGRRGHE